MAVVKSFLLAAWYHISIVEALRCITCDNANSHEECRVIGTTLECRENQESCFAEVRVQHERTQIKKMCKQARACENNVIQNDRLAWSPSQCNKGDVNSVCRCCCSTDECNNLDGCAEPPATDVKPATPPTVTRGQRAKKFCEIPDDPVNGVVDCLDLTPGGTCVFTCDSRFATIGPNVTVCDGDLLKFVPEPPTCEPTVCPSLASVRLLYGKWDTSSCSDGNFAGSVCVGQCDEGAYSATIITTECQSDGEWSGLDSMCLVIQCPELLPTAGLMISCSNRNTYDSFCEFSCEEDKALVGAINTRCTISNGAVGIWNNNLPTCKTIVCKDVPSAPNLGSINCEDEHRIGNVCTFQCEAGYKIDGSKETVCTDRGDDRKPMYVPDSPNCVLVTCNPDGPILLPNGLLKLCSSSNDNGSTCKAECETGYHGSGALTSTCRNDGTWSDFIGQCEVVTCPEIKSPPEGTMECLLNNRKVDDVCTFSCKEEYVLQGFHQTTCTYNGAKLGNWSPSLPTCKRIECEILEIIHLFVYGTVSCTRDREVGTTCTINCNDGYWLEEDEELKCELDKPTKSGKWVGNPTCSRIRCTKIPDSIPFGEVECNGDAVGSDCYFSCRKGYSIGEYDYIKCEEKGKKEYGEWSQDIPTCSPLQCPVQGELKFGEIDCSSNNNVDSICKYQCLEKDYYLHPATSDKRTCQQDLSWTLPMPCCARSCPPFANMDLLVILDSSSSIGLKNWRIMMDFTKGFINQFDLSVNSARIGFFRYNRKIDYQTEVKMGEITDNEEMMKHLDSVPYNGVGTHTGNALLHAVDAFRGSENRPKSNDMILLITDGLSQDDATEPASLLREIYQTMTIKVLPILKEGSRDKEKMLQQVVQIAGGEDNVIMDAFQNNGFDQLNDATIAMKIGEAVCGDPCYHTTM